MTDQQRLGCGALSWAFLAGMVLGYLVGRL